MRKLDWIYYRPGDFALIPRDSVVVLQDRADELDAVDGAFLAARGLRAIVYMGCGEDRLHAPSKYDVYLAALKDKLARKGIVPYGLMIEEEWHDRVNNPADVGGWASFRGLDPWQKKTWLRDRLATLVDRVHAAFPGVPVIAVEMRWNESRAAGPDLWYPDFGADILGLDSYLYAKGWSRYGTPPLKPEKTSEQLTKFGMEVSWSLHGSPDGKNTGALSRGKPVILVAQAFRDRDAALTWGTAPGAAQLRWWFELAQSFPRVMGLAWFAVASAPSIIGLDAMPDLRAAVEQLRAENDGAPAQPAPAPAAPAPTQPPAPTPATTLCTIAVRSDNTLVITSASGHVQTVTM